MAVRRMSIKTFREIMKEGIIGDRQEVVFEHIFANPNLTDREIAQNLGQDDPNFVRPRRFELVRFGLIEETDRRPCSVTGRTASQWRVKKDATIEDVKNLRKKFQKQNNERKKKKIQKVAEELSRAVKNQMW